MNITVFGDAGRVFRRPLNISHDFGVCPVCVDVNYIRAFEVKTGACDGAQGLTVFELSVRGDFRCGAARGSAVVLKGETSDRAGKARSGPVEDLV